MPRLLAPHVLAVSLQSRRAWNTRRSAVFVPCKDEGRRHLRYPRQPSRLRGDARGGRRERRVRAVVPGRSRRLWSRARCVRRARARARRRVSRRQPRSRRHRRDPARRVLARREPRGAVDAGGDRAGEPRVPRRPEPQGRGGARRPLPRQPARPGLGVRALGAARRAVPGRPTPARLPDRALARRAVVRPPRRRARHRRAATRPARSSTSPTANGCSTRAASASRATATRAPRGCCSTSTRWQRPFTAPTTTSPAPPPRSARRDCPTRWPSAWSTVSEHAPPRTCAARHGQRPLRVDAGRRCSVSRRRCWSPAAAPAAS